MLHGFPEFYCFVSVVIYGMILSLWVRFLPYILSLDEKLGRISIFLSRKCVSTLQHCEGLVQ